MAWWLVGIGVVGAQEPVAAPARPEPVVVDAATQPERVSPSGAARMTPLLRGEDAFVGLLQLDPGAVIPENRDPSGEYVWILEGEGTLTVAGVAHAVTAGSAAYLPAEVPAGFVAGPAPVRVLQVFADPGPAAKYDGWTPGSVGTAGFVGPFAVRCDQGFCAIRHGGVEVVDDLWCYARPEDLLAPLNALGLDQAWLVREHAGDGCPTQVRVLCLGESGPAVTEPFGNCEEVGSLRVSGRSLTVQFPAARSLQRRRTEVVVDLASCSVVDR